MQRALEISDSLTEAHVALGNIERSSWNFSEAEREYKRAIELNPNYALAHARYGDYLRIVRGKLDEAMAEVKLARQLDPLSLDIILNLGILHGWKGELDAAIEEYKKLLEMDRNSARAHAQLGTAYRRQGRDEEAIAETEKAVELSGRRDWHAALGLCYALAGKKAKAKAILEEIEKNYAKGLESGQNIAQVYAALGDKERAFAWPEKDFQARDGNLPWLAYNGGRGSLRDALSSDPRWNDLLRRIGLPQN